MAHPIEVLGVDRNAGGDSRRAGGGVCWRDWTTWVRFEAGGLDTREVLAAWTRAFGGTNAPVVHGVFALHACDTATCDALALGIALRAELIAVAPCCQAELARAWSALRPRATPAHSARSGSSASAARDAAHITDAMAPRCSPGGRLRGEAMEFVLARAHRKNTLSARSSARPVTRRRSPRTRRCDRNGGAGIAAGGAAGGLG